MNFLIEQKKLFERFKQLAEQLSQYTWIGIFFAMPVSRALFHIFVGLTVIFTLTSGNYLKKYKTIRENFISFPFLILLIIVLIGSTYTVANQDELMVNFGVYSKIIYMILFLSIINTTKIVYYALLAFSTAMCITIISTYLNIWYVLPWSLSQQVGLGHSHHVFRDYIVQGLYTSFFSILCLYSFFKAKHFYIKSLCIILYLFSSGSILYLLGSRTGYLAFFLSNTVFFLFIFLNKSFFKKNIYFYLLLTALIIILGTIIYFSSELLQNRINLIIEELKNYKENKITSSGMRLYMWITAYDLFTQAPLFGHGTASYPILSKIIFNNKGICDIACPHPHNQFLLFAVEYGLVGVLCLLFIIWRFVKASFILPVLEKSVLLSFMAIFIVDCMTHGALWLRMESYFFVYMFGLLSAYAHLRTTPSKAVKG